MTFKVIIAVAIAFAALFAFRAWFKPAQLREPPQTLSRMITGMLLSGVSVLIIFFGPLWAALAVAVGAALHVSAFHFGRRFLAVAKGRSRSAQTGIIVLWTIQAAGFFYAFVVIALDIPRNGAA